jgi:hypothetical protein
MRTTLTLDDDLARRLKAVARREDRSFKDVVNATLLRGLVAQERASDEPPYSVETFSSRLRPGVDPLKLNQLVDELEAREALEKGHRAAGERRSPGRGLTSGGC